MNDRPLISVLLPVYNAADYIKASIDSILNQTYSHFELIIINDGSTDQSETIIKKFNDKRIRYFYQNNQGLANALNAGINLSIGSLIARQDGDDISKINRFEEQVNFLGKHPEVMLLGTHAEIINEEGKLTNQYHKHPITSPELKTCLLFDNPFVHSSVIFRKEILNRTGNYTNVTFEDYTLWSSISNISEVANLPQLLVAYRQVSSGISQTIKNYKQVVIDQSLLNCISYLDATNEQDLKNMLSIYHADYTGLKGTIRFEKLNGLLSKLLFNFSKKNNYTLTEMNADKHKHFFRRSYYSYKIDSGLFPVAVVLLYKIKRKLFLSIHK